MVEKSGLSQHYIARITTVYYLYQFNILLCTQQISPSSHENLRTFALASNQKLTFSTENIGVIRMTSVVSAQ